MKKQFQILDISDKDLPHGPKREREALRRAKHIPGKSPEEAAKAFYVHKSRARQPGRGIRTPPASPRGVRARLWDSSVLAGHRVTTYEVGQPRKDGHATHVAYLAVVE